jgi:group I intron endonuclease
MTNRGPKEAGIYCIRNTVSGRRYVGSAGSIRQRWYSHRHLLLKGIHHSPSLLRSWIKHGESAFVFEVLEIVTDPKRILEREQHWIDELQAADPKAGFNMSPTAGSSVGHRWSDEARARASSARKGVPKSSEGRDNIAAAAVIKNKSSKMREMVRASKLQLYASPEKRDQLRDQALKMWEDRRLSGLPLARPHTEEAKKKMSIAKKGKMSEAHKAAIAKSNKSRWQTFGAAVK